MAEISSKLKQKKIVVVENSDESDDYEEKNESVLGLALDKLSLGKKKKLLVLSLGGLLCHRVFRYKLDKIPKRRSDTSYGSFLVYKRPFAEDFLKFCLDRFEVGLWSSAREWYIDNALNCLMRGLRQKVAFIWDQNKCTDSGFKSLENSKKPVYLKVLKHVWDNKYGDLTWSKGHFSAADTLMIDDEPYKSLLNPPNTAVFLREYHADDLGDEVLGPDSELRKYLDGVAEADNVPEYVKSHPFGLPAITPAHPHWDFYSKIINEN